MVVSVWVEEVRNGDNLNDEDKQDTVMMCGSTDDGTDDSISYLILM